MHDAGINVIPIIIIERAHGEDAKLHQNIPPSSTQVDDKDRNGSVNMNVITDANAYNMAEQMSESTLE